MRGSAAVFRELRHPSVVKAAVGFVVWVGWTVRPGGESGGARVHRWWCSGEAMVSKEVA